MRAWIQNGYGTSDVYELQQIKQPVPKNHEVCVKVMATAVNDWEWGVLEAPLPVRLVLGMRKPHGRFRIMGCDMAGVVESTGSSVTTFKPGDAVYGDLSGYRFGAFAEYVCVNEKSLAIKPATLSFEQAAAIPHAAELALQAIQKANPLQPGQRVLVNGAGGGVGTQAIQLLRQYGVETTAVDNGDKLALLKSLGYDHVIDYRDVDFTNTGQRYDFILDTKTSRTVADYARALNPGGVYATVGGKKIFRFMLRAIISKWFYHGSFKLVGLKPNKNLQHINQLIGAGVLQPTLDGPYRFDEIPAQLERFRRGEHLGKIVIALDAHAA